MTALIFVGIAAAIPCRALAKNNAANIWYFAAEAGLDFNSGSAEFLPGSAPFFTEGSAIICDDAGQLLFYTDGSTVWNSDHLQMRGGSGLKSHAIAAQPGIIVPQPGNTSMYYIFTVSDYSGLSYSIVDMTAAGGAGAMIDKNIPLWSAAASKITAVHHQNGTDVWVIVPGAEENRFRAYLVTAEGVAAEPVISHCGRGHSKQVFDQSGMLKAAPDGTRLALSVFEPGYFEVFPFDSVHGKVSQPILLDGYEGAYGVEFSPDSTKLYGTVVNWVQKKIYQFDVHAADIPSSVQVVGTTEDDARFHALQVAPDGRIYVVRENAGYLGVINYPNRAGEASEYIDDGVYLEGYRTRHGLPTFVQSFFTPPVIELSVHDAQAAEGDEQLIFPVTLSEAGRNDVSVTYRAYNGEAEAGKDFFPASGNLTIPEGEVEGSISVSLIDDESFDEGEETFFLELGQPRHAVLAESKAIGIIRDNDLVELSIEDAATPEDGGAMRFAVSLSEPSRSDVSAEYALVDDTAIAGQDYVAAAGTVTIPAGAQTASISVQLVDNAVDEADRAFRLELSSPVNAALVKAQASGTIQDDDAPPSIVIDDVVMTEQTGTMEFTVRLSTTSRLDVFVEYATGDDSAHAGSDYSATSGRLLIPAGMTLATILIDLRDDVLDEANEGFHVHLSQAENAIIRDDTALGLIRDNDPSPTLTMEDVTCNEDEGQMTFIARLSEVSGRDVRVRYATRDGSALDGEDYEAVSGDLLIPAGNLSAAITIPLRDDRRDESDETVFLCLNEAKHVRIAQDEALGTIRDTDPPPSLSINDVSAAEDTGTLTFSVELFYPTYQDVTVRYATRDGAATLAGDDYRVIPDSMLTIPSGEMRAEVSVSITDDPLIEGDETLFVALYEPLNATLAKAQGIGTIRDNDALPELWIEAAEANEQDGRLTFTVHLSQASTLPVIFSYRTRPGTAGDGDYAAEHGEMAIVPDSLSAPIVVQIYDDALTEHTEHFTLELSSVRNATGIDTQAEGRIRDNEE